jgi:hypothetical protein
VAAGDAGLLSQGASDGVGESFALVHEGARQRPLGTAGPLGPPDQEYGQLVWGIAGDWVGSGRQCQDGGIHGH